MAYGDFRGGSGGFRRGFRKNFGPREQTKIKCSECGKEDTVPFKPREGTPVYCRECFLKRRGITPRPKEEKPEEPEKESEDSEEQIDELETEENKESEEEL